MSEEKSLGVSTITSGPSIALFIKRNHVRFIYSIRALSFIFVVLYIVAFYKYFDFWYEEGPRPFWAWPVFYLVCSIVLNFGLFFLTTPGASKRKFLASLSYSPTIFMTPILIGAFIVHYWGFPFGGVAILVAFFFFLFVYGYLNPEKE